MGKSSGEHRFKNIHVVLLVVFVGLFYAFFYIGNKNALILLSFVALFGITRYGYLICCSSLLEKWYNNKWVGSLVYIISQLCLEVYLIQKYIFTDELNDYFPLNIPVIMAAVFLAAYLVKTLAEFISQTFKSEFYQWGKMLLRK